MLKWTKRLALVTCIGMFIIVMAGAVVTQTESGEGCGTDWPLCHGKFIPAYSIPSIIEYNHRLVTSIGGLLVLGTFIAVMKHVKRKEAKLYASAALFFTILQAALGALAVIYPTSPLVMALHFGFSLLGFASTLLLVLVLRKAHLPDHPSGWGEATEGSPKVSRGFMWMVWLTLIYTYVVVYLGAYVRHMDAAAGCGRDWPLCNGEVIPSLEGIQGVAFIHRLGALLLFLLVAWVAHIGYRRYHLLKEVRTGSIAIIVLTVAQVLSGALVVFSLNDENLYLFTSLLHSFIILFLFSILCYLSIITWLLREGRDEQQ
ncbi:COX15/CtaA family protein [Marinicrinis lubricantis]|uniref:Heme A synthase n=1 Tax=Marinicrinis lubricantis TaxID=2086470 RepID=A0ABW1IV01_9BACL